MIYALVFCSVSLSASLGQLAPLLVTEQFGYSKKVFADLQTWQLLTIVFGALPIAGWLADRVDRFRVFQAGLILSTAHSLIFWAWLEWGTGPGQIFEEKLSWAAMVGAGSRNNSLSTGLDYDTGPEGYFRLFAQPFREETSIPEFLHGLRFGVGGSIGWQSQSTAGTAQLFQNYSTDGGNTFFTFPNGLNVQGEHWRISPQMYYTYGPFEFFGEFIAEKQGVNTAGVGAGGGFTNYETTAWNVTDYTTDYTIDYTSGYTSGYTSD